MQQSNHCLSWTWTILATFLTVSSHVWAFPLCNESRHNNGLWINRNLSGSWSDAERIASLPSRVDIKMEDRSRLRNKTTCDYATMVGNVGSPNDGSINQRGVSHRRSTSVYFGERRPVAADHGCDDWRHTHCIASTAANARYFGAWWSNECPTWTLWPIFLKGKPTKRVFVPQTRFLMKLLILRCS